MSALAPASIPLRAAIAGFRRFSVAEYHRLIELGVLTEDDNVELLNGYLVHKMARIPPHDGAIDLTNHALQGVLPKGWLIRIQEAVTLAVSEPEPDIAVVRGTPRSYLTRHPTPADIGLLIEVADSSLDSDRSDKGPIFAQAGVTVYWIVNLVDRTVEVYRQPSAGGYQSCHQYPIGDDVPLELGGNVVAKLPVADLLP